MGEMMVVVVMMSLVILPLLLRISCAVASCTLSAFYFFLTLAVQCLENLLILLLLE